MKTILVVDDSPTMLKLLKSLLSVASYNSVTASDATQALDHLSKQPFDAMLTDLNMPGMNGIELVAEVRKLAAAKAMPILILSTEGEASRRDEAKKAGANGWLVKPVAGPDLVATLKRVLPGA